MPARINMLIDNCVHVVVIPPANFVWGGILESLGRSVGWLVGWPVFCPQSVCTHLWSELLLHFLVNWIETWHMYSSWSEDVQDTIFMFAFPGVAELSALELWLKTHNGYLGSWVCGANFFHISWLIGLKLGICIYQEVQMCKTQFSCPPAQSLQSYLPLNFDLKHTMAI